MKWRTFPIGTGVGAVALCGSVVSGQTSFSDGLVADILPGGPVIGSLEPGNYTLPDGSYFESWRLDISTPSLLAIELTSIDFDPFLALVLPDDTILDFNDDCLPGNTDVSCLEDVPVEAGTYYIVVNTYTAGEEGAYSLSVSAAAPIPEPVTGWLVVLGAGALMRRQRR